MLLAAGCDINACDSMGNTFLHGLVGPQTIVDTSVLKHVLLKPGVAYDLVSISSFIELHCFGGIG